MVRSNRDRRSNGFSLIECVVALALLGVALLAATSLLSVLATSTVRTEMHSAMLRELENAVEMMRAGVVPLNSGAVSFSDASKACPDHLSVNAVVSEGEIQGLFQVVLRAECRLGADRATKVLRTQVWNP